MFLRKPDALEQVGSLNILTVFTICIFKTKLFRKKLKNFSRKSGLFHSLDNGKIDVMLQN